MTNTINCFLYHQVPEDIKGDNLRSLNYFKNNQELNPDFKKIYEEEVKKYVGREGLMTSTVVNNIQWLDCIFLTLHHPNLLFKYKLGIGKIIQDTKFYKIPLDLCSPNESCIYDTISRVNGEIDQTKLLSGLDYHKIDVSTLPNAYFEYNLECKKNGKRPLRYQGIHHYLCPNSINISGVEVIELRIVNNKVCEYSNDKLIKVYD
jgi:hypothetical protein